MDGRAQADYARGSLWQLIFSLRERSNKWWGADSNLAGHVARASGPVLEFGLLVLRKKRQSHSSHRYGLTENLAMKDSRNPRDFDRWMWLLLHEGQFMATAAFQGEKVRRAEKTSQPGPLDSSKSLVPPALNSTIRQNAVIFYTGNAVKAAQKFLYRRRAGNSCECYV